MILSILYSILCFTAGIAFAGAAIESGFNMVSLLMGSIGIYLISTGFIEFMRALGNFWK